MARRKDDPLLQAAKGFPGRRRKTVEKEIEAAAEAAVQQPVSADNPFPVPMIFTRAPVYWGEAIKLWHEKADVLRASGRRRPGYRSALTRYCIWTQLWVSAADQLRRDLPRGGMAIKVKKGDGETVTRTHPNIDFMSKAETALRLLDGEFGFTPRGDSDLTRVESFNAAQGKLPFGGSHAPTASADGTADRGDPMELMGDSDSAPPGIRPN